MFLKEQQHALFTTLKCYISLQVLFETRPLTLESGLNSLFLRILLKISVSSSCRLLSSVLDWLERLRRSVALDAEVPDAEVLDAEVLGVAAAVAPAAPEES